MSDDWETIKKTTNKIAVKPRHISEISPANKQRKIAREPELAYLSASNLLPLKCGEFQGVDSGTARRLKRGEIPVDIKLDTHGMNQDEALQAMKKTIATARKNGFRVALIVTGKGRAEGGGVIKKALLEWVNLPEIRPYLLSFCYAKPLHGGLGAFYLLLKRK